VAAALARAAPIFVNSMSDLFHESLTNEQIAAVFGVMARHRSTRSRC
jgi:protein gp37